MPDHHTGSTAAEEIRILRAEVEVLNDENLRLLNIFARCKETVASRQSIGVFHALAKIATLVADPSLKLSVGKAAIVDLLSRRAVQNRKWGVQNHDPITWSAILTEETGEFAQAALELKFGGPNAQGLRDEAIDCAAVALQIIECIDRNTPPATELKVAA